MEEVTPRTPAANIKGFFILISEIVVSINCEFLLYRESSSIFQKYLGEDE
jgi:hypothetical protein